MGIEGIENLTNRIVDMQNFIRSRQEKGKVATDIIKDLQEYGYDYHAARGLIMLHWNPAEEA